MAEKVIPGESPLQLSSPWAHRSAAYGWRGKDYAINSFTERTEKMKYKEKYRKAEKIWKQRYETLQEKYLDLRKKAQPYLDAMEFAAETVRAFLDAVLSRGKETQEHKLSAHRRWYDKDLLWRDCLLNKYYEEAKYNAAFDRCVDVMSRMLQKYGHQVLDKLEQDAPKTEEYSKDDTETQPLADKVA